jgi:hypothetical protein
MESLEIVIKLIEVGADLAQPARLGIKRTALQAAAEVGN